MARQATSVFTVEPGGATRAGDLIQLDLHFTGQQQGDDRSCPDLQELARLRWTQMPPYVPEERSTRGARYAGMGGQFESSLSQDPNFEYFRARRIEPSWKGHDGVGFLWVRE